MIIIQTLHHLLLKTNKKYCIIKIVLFLFTFALFADEIIINQTNSIYELSKWNWYFTDIDPFLKENEKQINWQAIQIPSNPKEYTKKSEIWYRVVIKSQLPLKESLGINLGIISDRDRVYWNGVKIGETGRWDSPYPEAYDRTRIYEVPPYLVKEENELIVHVKGYFDHEVGIIRGDPKIGSYSLLQKKYYYFNGTNLFFLFIYLSVGSYFLFLFLRRLKERENLFFGIFMFLLVIYLFLRNPLKYELTSNLFLLKRIEYITLFLLFPFFYFFIYYYYQKYFSDSLKQKIFFKIHKIILFSICYLTIASSLVILLFDDVKIWDKYNTNVIQLIFWPPIIISIFSMLIYLSFRKNIDAIIMISGFFIVIAGAILDVLINRNIINFPNVSTYTFFSFILSLSVVLTNQYVRLNIEIEELNKTLEYKVIERTKELQESLDTIQKLKEKQDGDYYLTSLIQKPLNQVIQNTEIFNIEIYLKQFKEFTFRNKKDHIGGDIIISDQIILDNHPCTVFLNGDAMGKSIQGAGGAIVLGTVFLSILKRTKLNSSNNGIKPSKWLTNAYQELQNVFVTFGGSMLCSAVIGILDEVDKRLYFINAEHPGVILYRNQKATFLQRETDLRKLGVSLFNDSLKIYSFHLQPGDIIFVGSDGKDDLEIRNGDEVHINEDENLFLSFIEKSNGNLQEIIEQIQKTGNLIDDISIIKIIYKY